MKVALISVAIILGINTYCQSPNDSAYTKNLALQARVIVYLVPRTLDPSNDSLYSVFIKWRAALRNNPVSGTTTVTIDTIPTVELANLYSYVLQQADGLGVGALMKSQLTSARSANQYLQRLCTAIEDAYSAQLANIILIGRRLLLGR